MALIGGVIYAVGAAFIGLIGHVLAHDFCQRAPTLARWMLSLATKRLPFGERQRYSEEWDAHLVEAEGVVGKLWHALGCLWCAHRMHRQAYKRMELQLSFSLPRIGRAAVRTNLYEASVAYRLLKLCVGSRSMLKAFGIGLVMIFYYRVFVDVRTRTGVTRNQFFDLLKCTKREDWTLTSITVSAQGKSIEVLGLLRAGGAILAMIRSWTDALAAAKASQQQPLCPSPEE
jgi:hypothetical protein